MTGALWFLLARCSRSLPGRKLPAVMTKQNNHWQHGKKHQEIYPVKQPFVNHNVRNAGAECNGGKREKKKQNRKTNFFPENRRRGPLVFCEPLMKAGKERDRNRQNNYNRQMQNGGVEGAICRKQKEQQVEYRNRDKTIAEMCRNRMKQKALFHLQEKPGYRGDHPDAVDTRLR